MYITDLASLGTAYFVFVVKVDMKGWMARSFLI
jgi:hypothetical protein